MRENGDRPVRSSLIFRTAVQSGDWRNIVAFSIAVGVDRHDVFLYILLVRYTAFLHVLPDSLGMVLVFLVELPEEFIGQ